MHKNEFENRCIKQGNIRPINTQTDRDAVAATQQRIATDCIEAAEALVGTKGEARAVGQAYFAMEHKANELLARNGWESKAHDCTAAALEMMLKRKDLADRLALSYRDRKKYDYTHDPRDLATGKKLRDLIDTARAFMLDCDAGMPRR